MLAKIFIIFIFLSYSLHSETNEKISTTPTTSSKYNMFYKDKNIQSLKKEALSLGNKYINKKVTDFCIAKQIECFLSPRNPIKNKF